MVKEPSTFPIEEKMNLNKKGELVALGKFVELYSIRQKQKNVHYKNQFVKHPCLIHSTQLTATFTIKF